MDLQDVVVPVTREHPGLPQKTPRKRTKTCGQDSRHLCQRANWAPGEHRIKTCIVTSNNSVVIYIRKDGKKQKQKV
jgi:hypothetical protein